jgi:hypothetical protein
MYCPAPCAYKIHSFLVVKAEILPFFQIKFNNLGGIYYIFRTHFFLNIFIIFLEHIYKYFRHIYKSRYSTLSLVMVHIM